MLEKNPGKVLVGKNWGCDGDWGKRHQLKTTQVRAWVRCGSVGGQDKKKLMCFKVTKPKWGVLLRGGEKVPEGEPVRVWPESR